MTASRPSALRAGEVSESLAAAAGRLGDPVHSRVNAVANVLAMVSETASGANDEAEFDREAADLVVRAEALATFLTASAQRGRSDAEQQQVAMMTEALSEQASRVASNIWLLGARKQRRAAPALDSLAKTHVNEAAAHRRAARLYLLCAAVPAALLVASLGWGLIRLDDVAGGERPSLLWAHAGVAAALAAMAAVLHRSAERRSRLAEDHTRQHDQLSLVNEYLRPLPPELAHLLRAVLMPRVFGRSVDDDDPLRDPVWPSPAEITKLVAP